MKKKRRTKTKSRIKKARKRQMSAVSIQRLRTLAGQIGEVIPATSFGKGGFCFATIAKKMGLQKHWSSGTKKEAIFGLLKPLYRDHPKMFYRIFRENIARGIERRHKLGNPVLEPEILALDRTLRDLDVNLSREFKALNLPKERPRIVPPPAGFQKMVDELGLHPFLQPDCAKLFKDGHINESVRKALEKYEVYIQKKAGITKIGANLMAHAFSESNPLVPVADVNQPRGKGLQEGFKFLSMGAMEFWRNFCSHGDEKQVPHQDAIAIIAVVSHLLTYVDQSTSPPSQ
jgi:uncharacterized protein (TIGR02391 family)